MSRRWSVPCSELSAVEPFPALTTVFTPPSYCSTYFTDEDAWAGESTGISGTIASYGVQNEEDPVWYSCVPKGYDTEKCHALTFSPGLCPHGWTTLRIRTEASVTTARCCMSGFVLSTSDDVCLKKTTDFSVIRRPDPDPSTTTYVSVVSWDDSTAWATVYGELTSTVLDSSPLDPDSSLYMTVAPPTTTETVTMSDGTLSHSAWVIMWQSSDRTSTSATSATSTPAEPTEQPETHTGLSGGAIAGIVVGVVAALVLGVMMGILIQRRRQRPVQAPGAHEQPIFVQQSNAGSGFGAEQSPNGPVDPSMAYAVGGTAVGSGQMQPKE